MFLSLFLFTYFTKKTNIQLNWFFVQCVIRSNKNNLFKKFVFALLIIFVYLLHLKQTLFNLLVPTFNYPTKITCFLIQFLHLCTVI